MDTSAAVRATGGLGPDHLGYGMYVTAEAERLDAPVVVDVMFADDQPAIAQSTVGAIEGQAVAVPGAQEANVEETDITRRLVVSTPEGDYWSIYTIWHGPGTAPVDSLLSVDALVMLATDLMGSAATQ